MTPITGTVVNFPINPITKHFRITRQVASAGPEMVWKIFDAVRTDTNELCSVFLFEKYIADKLHKPRRREIVTNMLKREVNLLTQLNHPNLLHVVYPVVETSENIAFASEHVMLSLANYFGNHTRMPQPLPEDVQNFQLDELDRKMGLYQLTDALRFLHSGQSLFHNNVCPSAILLTLRKQWRLSSLAFVEACQDDNSLRSNGKISMEKTIRTHG
ncbi:unnamed protein product, partial [Dicrocoelium dendriticum]